MTESEWGRSTGLCQLVTHGRGTASERKLCLPALGIARRVEDTFTAERRQAAREVQLVVDRHGRDVARLEPYFPLFSSYPATTWIEFLDTIDYAFCGCRWGRHPDTTCTLDIVGLVGWVSSAVSEHAMDPFVFGGRDPDVKGARRAERAEEVAHAHLARCVFGNPFRPVAADPRWLTSTVLGLAEGISADGAFERLPILADALEVAGCDHPAVLKHCRGRIPHIPGRWVIDLLLGRA